MTEAKKRLWRELREFRLPQRFRPQHPIGRYIVDFACPAVKLAIELDGGQHALRGQDQNRTVEIASRRYRITRFWNGDMMENIGGVLETISRELAISLSALGGGEGQGEVGDSPVIPSRGGTHLTLPAANATGSLPLPPEGRRGRNGG
jgi:very-short-patch-repair endonuclease